MKLSLVTLASLVAASSMVCGVQTPEEKHPWLVRVRMLDMVPVTRSRAFSALGNNFPANAITFDKKIYPEVDFSYFFNKNLAVEFVFAYPQQTKISLLGVGHVGSVTHWSPMLALQYHYPIPKTAFTPYVGVGVNYVHILKTDLNVGPVAFTETKDHVGFCYGGGLDYKIDDRWSLNLDFKLINIGTNVKLKATGAIVTNLDSRPSLYSIGVGYRF